ncbi:MAG: hypothetical protein JWP40_3085 [Blastococcus sp.]|jgi:hypothetical protein|nr:hypothetical protein [Blastococcus sp.]
MSASSGVAAPAPRREVLRHVLSHLIVPFFLATGMALAYLGAFHQPEPKTVRLDVVGSGPQVAVLAQTIQNKLGDRAVVHTVPTVGAARSALEHREIAGAYVPDVLSPSLMLAGAASDTTAVTVERMLAPVALAEGLPLRVDDVAPAGPTDPTGQGIFFYLVALSVGSYSAAIAIGAAGGRLPMRIRALLAVGAAAVISVLCTVIAGPLYGALTGHAAAIGLLAWIYASAVVLIGVGLHTFLGRWTTATLVALFVMLNFTSSGGIFAPALQPGFFASLHAFWIGSGLVEAGRTLEYFPALGIGHDVTILLLWLAAGLAVVALAAAAERRRSPVAAAPTTAASPRHAAPTPAETDAHREAEVEEEAEAVPVG